MKDQIQISPEQNDIICKILNEHLPREIKVWVFGSRVTGKSKQYSDLDLALQNPNGKVDPRLIMKLEQAFEESLLPWQVDLIDMSDVTEEFRQIIEHDKILFQI